MRHERVPDVTRRGALEKQDPDSAEEISNLTIKFDTQMQK